MIKSTDWAELHSVLPYEGFECEKYFVNEAYRQIKELYKEIPLTKEELKKLVVDLNDNNYYFGGLLYAFRQVHKHINPQQMKGLDFRVVRPLDYFALLALRVEVCFRYKLGYTEYEDKKTLPNYIEELARKKEILSVIDFFETKRKKGNSYIRANEYTKQDNSVNPIDKIMNLQCDEYDAENMQLLQACLCCYLARNYFSHNFYMDEELIGNRRAGFLFCGVLITALVLLDSTKIDV